MVKRWTILGKFLEEEEDPRGEWVQYEDYQKLEEENKRLNSTIQRIDTTPANEIIYPWRLYSEGKDG